MAFKLTKLEKVLATAVGLDIARPGTSRAAFTRAAQAAVAVIPRVAPPVARGAVGVTLAAVTATVGPYLRIPLPIAGAALTSALLAALPIGAVSLPPLKKSAIPKAIAMRSKSLRDI